MSWKSRQKPAPASSRRGILDLLKVRGPSDSQALASCLGISPMAVRQHLYALRRERLVSYATEERPFGRPPKVWRLEPAAESLFPDAHAELCVNLIRAAGTALGRKGLDRSLSEMVREQVEWCAEKISQEAPFAKRLKELARIRTAQGYLAEVKTHGNETYTLIENHCPIGAAAAACSGLCGAEIELFQRLLGPHAVIERLEHIQAGNRRCLYRIQNKPGQVS